MCKKHNLTLNVQKCQSIYKRCSVQFSYQYNIDLVELSIIDCVKDLGVLFDSKLTFSRHVDYRIFKSLAILEFIQPNSTEFNGPTTILCLYNLLVRPHLEYCCVTMIYIWHEHPKSGKA